MKTRETYWPCAPDGFIPNSIVRENYIIKNTIEVQEERWKPPQWRAEWGDFPHGSGLTEEDEGIKTWLSDDDDKTDISSNDSIDNHRSRISSKLSKQNEVNGRYFNTDTNLPDIMPGVSHGIISSNEKKTLSWTNGSGNDGLYLKKVMSQEEFEVQKMHNMKLYLPPINDEQEIDGNQLIPYPFLQYYKEEWFPKQIGYEVSTVCEALINGLKTTATDDLKDVLHCLIKAHRFSPLTSKNLKKLISILLELLENEDPILRMYAAKALRELQNNQENVIVRLIQKLEDPSLDVREEVKVTLKEIAGIVDASTLKAILRNLGKYKEMDIPNDASVIGSFQDHLLAERQSFKNRIKQLYSNYGENDKKMLGTFYNQRRPRRAKLPKIQKGNLRQVIAEENEIANDYISVDITVSEKSLSPAQERTLLVITPEQEEDIIHSFHPVESLSQQSMNIPESLIKNKGKCKRLNNTQLLERLTLKASIKALREKRLNSDITVKSELVEIFQDIALLFEFLETDYEKSNSTIKKKISEVHDIHERLRALERNDLKKDRDLPSIQRLIPSSILQNMQSNVIGERILVGFHVLPKIHQSPDETIRTRIIRPIPERNGCATAERYGSTSYGMMDYKWTTYASYYDRGVNVFNELEKQDVYTNNDEHITYRNDRFGNSSTRKQARLKIQSNKISDRSTSPIKYNTILPKIKRELNRCNDRENGMRPSIAVGTVI